MSTSPTPRTPQDSTDEPLTVSEIAYFNQRLRNRIFAAVMEAFAQEVASNRTSKALLARRLDKDPAQITRWFSGPGNWTLDTVSSLLLAMDAELEPRVCFFRDMATPNFVHPVADKAAQVVGYLDTKSKGATQTLTERHEKTSTNTRTRSAAQIEFELSR